MSDIQTTTEQAARDARDVFESYGSKAREAIDYMEQLIYAAMRKTEPASARIAALTARNREIALDVLASSGQAQEAYAAQLAAEARISELVEECNQLEVMARDYAEEAAALRTKVARLEGALGGVSASLHQLARDRDLSEAELDFMRGIDAALTDGG